MRWLLILVVVLSTTTAHGDQRDDAKREFAAGQAADKSKDWANAIDHYLRAYELLPHPFALYNIAVDYEELGNLREASHYYTKYIADPASTDRDRIARLLLDLKVRPSKLTIKSEPDGARVTIDGQVVGTTPYLGKLKGGKHEIVVDRDNRREQKQITNEFADPIDLAFSMGANGTLFVDGTPVGAKVTVDGNVVGEMPVQVPVEAGDHRVQLAMEGFAPVDTSATVVAGMVTRIQPVMEKGDATGVFKLSYFLGAGAGLDVRGNGSAYDFELGLRGKQYEIALTIGKVIDLTSVEIQVRWAMLPGKFSPVLGAGYSYLGSANNDTNSASDGGAGYEALAGLRYEVVSNEKVGIALLGVLTARYNTDTSTASDPMAEAKPTGVFPLTFRVQVYYR